MFSATYGNIFVNKQELEENIENIRKKIGLCHQTNVHYDDLTVEDNIKIVALIKEIPSK
jgi:ABC-type multidrug transport system ATPase subunit